MEKKYTTKQWGIRCNFNAPTHEPFKATGEVVVSFKYLESAGELEYNAKLIFASPKLLEACEKALSIIKEIRLNAECREVESELIEIIKEATE